MVQYPYYLLIVEGGDTTQDADGNWLQETETNTFVSMCRDETNGGGRAITNAGGEHYVFSSLVQLPKECDVIAEGTTVLVSYDKEGSNIRVSGKVAKFDKGRLHCRLWL